MTEHYYDATNKLIIKTYVGEITLEIITTSWIDAIKCEKIPEETIGFILDYTNATFQIDLKQLDIIPKFYQKNLHVFGGKKVAIVTNNPKDVVVPVMVKLKDKGYQSAPFSTMEAAKDWILNK